MTTLRTLLHTGRGLWLLRGLIATLVLSLAWLQVSPAYAADHALLRHNAQVAQWQRAHAFLPSGLTDTPDVALWAKITARRAAIRAARLAAHLPPNPLAEATAELDPGTGDGADTDAGGAGGRSSASAAPAASRHLARATPHVADAPRRLAKADRRPLTAAEMARCVGRGPYRNPYFNGTLPWQRSLRDVNLCNGNLFKSFTDMQIAPARGAGLVLQRTYNSNDARIGPFGVGWTHAYDIRMQEAGDVKAQSGNGSSSVDGAADDVPRTDFFGAKHTYHRDADGLYSPPGYMFDETSSDYDSVLVNGPMKVMADTEKGEDGTVKHYINVVTLADGTEGNERACDYIQDRYGNRTTLSYGLSYVQADGSTRKLLTQVADPNGRSLAFTWTNLGTTGQPAYRITQVQGPFVSGQTVPGVTYRVTYDYYLPGDANAGGAAYQLKAVHLDPDGLNRTTTYTYTQYSDASGAEVGLLASVADPLGHTVSYTYAAPSSAVTNTLWVTTVTEPAGVDGGNSPRTLTWNISPGIPGGPAGDYQVTFGTSDNALMMHFLFDSQLRKSYYWLVDNWDDGLMGTTYDAVNNVTGQESDFNPNLGDDGFVVRNDIATYGAHGNVLTQGVANGSSGGNWTLYPGQTTTTWYNASQYFQKASVTDPNGHVTSMSVGTSTAGNTGDPDPNIGDRGQVLSVQDAGYNDAASPSYHKQFTYTYNQYGQKLTETNLNGVVTQYTYGTANDVVNGYYDLGNLAQVVQDSGGAGHLNRTTTMHYDAAGRVLQSTDPAGLTSSFTYNILGQPLSVATPAKAGIAPAETITYVYDGNGRTHSVTDNRGTTVMAYEQGSDRASSVTDPVTGTTGYTYLPTGERASMTLPGSPTPWAYAYQTMNTYINWCNMAKDDPNSLSRTLKSITDDQGRPVELTIDLTGKLISARSDEVFNPSGQMVSYAQTNPVMDTGGSIYSHLWLAQTKTAWHSYDFMGQGYVWHTRLVSENDYTYDNAGQRLTNLVTRMVPGAGGAAQYAGGTATYDGSGNATNEVTSSRTEKYQKPDGTSGYDALNRLTNVDYGDGQTQNYTFDAMGNRLSRQDSASGTTNYSYNAANMLLSTGGYGASGFTNDADGNTLVGNGRTNTWDSQNRLVSCLIGGNTTTYRYGADGLRRQSTKNGVSTDSANDGSMLVREGHASGGSLTASSVTATYLQGASGPCYRRDDTQTESDGQGHTFGKTRWYVNDGHGSVVGELDPLGNLTSSPKYDVYGATRSNGGVASSKQGFVGSLGHVSDDTGLVYMRARYYDPAVGRFASEDSAMEGNNWFLYCENDPVGCSDATGTSGAPDTILGGGWAIRIDGNKGDAVADLHIWKDGEEIGAIYNSGTWKHPTGGSSPLGENQTKGLLKAIAKSSNKRVRGWGKVIGGGMAVSSIDAYFENNPLDCISIMLDAGGDDKDAAAIDALNQS